VYILTIAIGVGLYINVVKTKAMPVGYREVKNSDSDMLTVGKKSRG